MNQKIKTLIIQAGGRGSRMDYLCTNKPKLLIDFKGKTVLQRYLEIFKDAEIIIIGDYKFDLLEKWVETFHSNRNIKLIKSNSISTYSGIPEAKKIIEHSDPIAIIWSDLILTREVFHNGEIQIITSNVECRYSYMFNKIKRKPNVTKNKIHYNGIIGLFTLKNKDLLDDNEHKSFVGEFLVSKSEIGLVSSKKISKVIDIGTKERYFENLGKNHSRSFNSIKKIGDKIVKICTDSNYKNLIENEIKWYRMCELIGFNNVPKIFKEKPLTIEYIQGLSPHKIDNFSISNLASIIQTLNSLHNKTEGQKVVKSDILDVYVKKPILRTELAKNLLYGFDSDKIIINNSTCLNPFHVNNFEIFKQHLINLTETVYRFTVIHGDPTSSNIIMSGDDFTNVTLIDPRGIFGKTFMYGDPDYDFAKLYYSLFGQYDFINDKTAWVVMSDYTVNTLPIAFLYDFNNVPKKLESDFYKLSGISETKNMLLQSTIWFSLTGYVVEDYDAMNIAFIKGVLYYNKYLKLKSL